MVVCTIGSTTSKGAPNIVATQLPFATVGDQNKVDRHSLQYVSWAATMDTAVPIRPLWFLRPTQLLIHYDAHAATITTTKYTIGPSNALARTSPFFKTSTYRTVMVKLVYTSIANSTMLAPGGSIDETCKTVVFSRQLVHEATRRVVCRLSLRHRFDDFKQAG